MRGGVRRALAWARRSVADGPQAERLLLDAERILCHLLGLGRADLYTDPNLSLSSADEAAFRAMFGRRLSGEPLQYLLGTEWFGSHELLVDPRVLIPRPETYLLIETALGLIDTSSGPCVVDLGCGSGNIALCLAVSGCRVLATDISPEALAVAGDNWLRAGVADRIVSACGDLYDALAGLARPGELDAVVSNPPYIKSVNLPSLQREVRFEPRLALDGGPDGLALVRRLVAGAAEWLRVGGHLVFEIGAGQADEAAAVVRATPGIGLLSIKRDDAGIERVVCAVRT